MKAEKILHLTIMKKWFDEVKSGKKKIEYSEINDYWEKRLFDKENNSKRFDFVIFKNGYSKNAPKLKVEFKGIKIIDKYEILLGNVKE